MNLNFDKERTLLEAKRTELTEATRAIDTALKALDQGTASPKVRKGNGVVAAVHAARKPMSDTAREKVRARMLAYWAAKRKDAKAVAAKGRRGK